MATKTSSAKTKLNKWIVLPAEVLTPAGVLKLAFAGLTLIMLVAQLFSFERLPELLAGDGIPGGKIGATVTAIILVILELASFAYLISNKLPIKLLKIGKASLFTSYLLIWILHSWAYGAAPSTARAIFLGDTFQLPGGFWTVILSSFLLVATIWIIWGKQLAKFIDKKSKK